MKILYLPLFLALFILGSSSLTTATTTSINYTKFGPNYGISFLNRTNFPQGFLFGTASSAYQYEGGAKEDGRGPSIWDTFTHKFPGEIADGKNGDVAVDSYHRYKEDVKIMKEMGLGAYRFSISWSRVLPYGKVSKGVNQKGTSYYHNLIDELLANGIQPFITLFHWDLPQSLQDEYGGFISPHIVDDFRDYADLCYREYGNKVKHWITLNEPWVYSIIGHETGVYSSKQCSKSHPENCKFNSSTDPYLVAHYLILAHAAAAQIYRQKYQASQKGVVGITLNSGWFIPYSQARKDHSAVLRALDFMLGWFMDPITYGDYPHTMRSLVGSRLPKFSREQSFMLKGSSDFVGLNYYSTSYAAYAPRNKNKFPWFYSLTNITSERNGIPIGPKAASDWLYVNPRGIHELLRYIKQKYKDPSIYITENGYDEPNDDRLTLEEALADGPRIHYYHSHLAFVQLAMRKGVKMKGYFAWSLLDNFEWNSGYTVRFGINYIDYKDGLKRYPKHSAIWFKNFLHKQKKSLYLSSNFCILVSFDPLFIPGNSIHSILFFARTWLK